MKALVSGGTGYVGRFIVTAMRETGWEVDATGSELPLDPDFDYSPNFDGMDAFIHCAFDHVPGRYRGGEGDDPEGFVRKNRDGSLKMFADAKAAGVSQAVFLSSRAVYGKQPPGLDLFEDTPPHPDTLYGQVKYDTETALKELQSDSFRAVSLRCTGVYGGMPGKWDALVQDYLSGKPIAPRVGTEVHGDDLGQAVLCVLKNTGHDLYNVSDILVDRVDILSPVQKSQNCSHKLPARGDHTVINAMNSDRLRSLGWTPGGWDRFKDYSLKLPFLA